MDEDGGQSSSLASLFTEGCEIAVNAVVQRADAAVFHGVPVIRMYLQAHPLVDALLQRSSKPVALALAGMIALRRGTFCSEIE